MTAMQGDTDRSTINARRPLTANMIAVLERLRAGPMRLGDMRQLECNAMRGLRDRGYAAWHVADLSYRATVAGLAAKGA